MKNEIQKILNELQAEGYVNQYHLDYYGGSILVNGIKFVPQSVEFTSVKEIKNRVEEKCTHINAFITDSGAKGILIFHSTNPNFDSCVRFMEKAMGKKAESNC